MRQSTRGRQSTPFLLRPTLWQIALPLALVLLSVGLGTVGFKQYYEVNAQHMTADGMHSEGVTWGHSFFQAVGLPIMETTASLEPGYAVPTMLQLARILGLLVPPYAFVLIVMVAFKGTVSRLRILRWRLTPWTKYAVVCGRGRMGRELINDLRRKHYKIVAIDAPDDTGVIPLLSGRGIVHFRENAASVDALTRASAIHADRVYVMTGDDAANARVVRLLSSLQPSNKAPANSLRCFVHMQDARKRELLCDTMRTNELEVSCFDLYETTARRLLSRRPICRFSKTRTHAEVLIMGYTPAAQAILLQTLRTGHFLPDQRLHISVIAPNAQECSRAFYEQYPFYRPDLQAEDVLRRLQEQIAPPIDFIELPRADAELLHDDFALYAGIAEDAALSVYLCLDNGLESAAHMAVFRQKVEILSKKRQGDVQIFYYHNCPEDKPAAPVLPCSTRETDVLVEPFGDFTEECSSEAIDGRHLDQLAKALSEYYACEWPDNDTKRAMEEMSKDERSAFFDRRWRCTKEWKRDSNRQAADHMAVKLLCIGIPAQTGSNHALRFSIADVEKRLDEKNTLPTLAEMEHRRWCAERILSGWTPLPASDSRHADWPADKENLQAQKLHAALVPFDHLPESEKTKDYSQIEAIPKFLRGMQKTSDT